MDAKSVRNRTFGAWLERQLTRREWNQAELARRMDVANGDVSRWVRNVRTPSPTTIDKLADVLGVDVDMALTLAGHRPATTEIDPEGPTARLMPLIERIQWTDERLSKMEMDLRWMIERDRDLEKE